MAERESAGSIPYRQPASALEPKNNFSGFTDMENSDIQAAERPYVGNELSMVVLMPR
jgi:serine protease inhibitor